MYAKAGHETCHDQVKRLAAPYAFEQEVYAECRKHRKHDRAEPDAREIEMPVARGEEECRKQSYDTGIMNQEVRIMM